jgi:hypothetical protein
MSDMPAPDNPPDDSHTEDTLDSSVPRLPVQPETSHATAPEEAASEALSTTDETRTNDGTSDEPQPSSAPNYFVASASKPKHRVVWFFIIVLLIGVITGGAKLYLQHTTAHTSVVLAKTTAANGASSTGVTVDDGYTFYLTPKRLGNLNFFTNLVELYGTNCPTGQTTNCPPNATPQDVLYDQIGTTPARQPIIAAYDNGVGEGGFYYIAFQTAPSTYRILTKISSGVQPTDNGYKEANTELVHSLSANVSLDYTDTIGAVTFPSGTSFNGEALALPSDYAGPTSYFIPGLTYIRGVYNGTVKLSTVRKIGSSGAMTLYEVTAENEPDYQVQEIYGVIGGVFATAYIPVDPLNSTSTSPAGIEWADNSINNSGYNNGSLGCGSAYGYTTADIITPSQLITAGTGPNGETIYQLPESSALFKDYYQDNYSEGTDLTDASLQNLSADQFQDDYAVIVTKNVLGEYVVYTRTDMFTGGGCGKPVLYLYPQKATDVNVSVGAHITASSPTYPVDGWQSVYALPNGQLTYGGSHCNSLYWEGTGFGVFPLITNGTVVARADADTTIAKQLSQQGIDTQEAAAFLAYWEPKLPTTPYVRLTWLDTAQMNELAPLSITPKPQTLLRVFLDFQGLNSPIPITPQTFTAPARKGFTVVEWGGLLRTTKSKNTL